MVKKKPSRTIIAQRGHMTFIHNRSTWSNPTRRGRGIHWEPAVNPSPVEEKLLSTLIWKGFISLLFIAIHCSPHLLLLRKFASVFTNPWRPLLCHISFSSLWQLNSQGKEPPAKFSAHFSYKRPPRRRRRRKLRRASTGQPGRNWVSLYSKREWETLAFVLHCGPPWEYPLNTVCKQMASSDF